MPVIVDLDKRIKHSKASQFTGVMLIQINDKVPWHLYFLAGQIVWADTKNHPNRRWHRQALKYDPNLIQQIQPLSYQILAKSVVRKKFSRERFSELVAGCISEILFDIIQQGTLEFQSSRKLPVYRVSPRDAAKFPCIALQYMQLWKQVQQDWYAWEQSDLMSILPNQAPVIVAPQELQERTSLVVFRALSGLLDGQQTLRDLALRVKQPMASLTTSLIPHMRNGFVRMIDVSDRQAGSNDINQGISLYQGHPNVGRRSQSVATAVTNPSTIAAATVDQQKNLTNFSINGPTVLYIDDSPTDSQKMEQIIQSAGYSYINIADPLQALPQLLEIKPQLIFLDLVMPVANGYELCAQIRRISAFRDTPVVIVTNNDGIADRVRAKVVGASGFMGKPIQQKKVLKILNKYLKTREKVSAKVHQPT